MAAEALTLQDEITMGKNCNTQQLNLDSKRVAGEDEYERMKEKLRESDEINIALLKLVKIQKDENRVLKEMLASLKEEIVSTLAAVQTIEAENQREIKVS